MSAQLDEDDIAKRVKAYRSRLYAPWPYALILLIPLVASLAKAPVSSAVLWTGTLSLYAVATFVRAFILGRRPNPLADIEPAVYRPWLREFNGAGRRMQIVLFSAMLGLWLWAGASRGAPPAGTALATETGFVLFAGLITAIFLLDVRLLPRRYRANEDLELVGALKNRAARWGGVAVLAVAVVGYPAQMIWPNFGPAVLAGVIWTACAGPLLIFAWLDYRTDADG